MVAARKRKNDEFEQDAGMSTDYEALTNTQLQRLLHKRMPGMRFMSASNENRTTVIAMLIISERGQ
jgi:hypothetical protein